MSCAMTNKLIKIDRVLCEGPQRPLVVGLDLTGANDGEIAGTLSEVHGFVLTLAGQGRRGDVRFHRYPDAVQVLEALAGR